MAKTGHMARMNAISPGEFVERRWVSEQSEVIEGLMSEYLVGVKL